VQALRAENELLGFGANVLFFLSENSPDLKLSVGPIWLIDCAD
jgi:hypothetical protein